MNEIIDEITGTKVLGYYETSISERFPNGPFKIVMYWGKSKKPWKNVTYKFCNQRDEALLKFKRSLQLNESAKVERRRQAKIETLKFKQSLKVGSILTCSWGYDQTNVEFYEILDVTKTMCKLIIQELGHVETEGLGSMSCHVTPDMNVKIRNPVRVPVRADYIRINTSISLTLWDGKSKRKSWYA